MKHTVGIFKTSVVYYSRVDYYINIIGRYNCEDDLVSDVI